MLRMENETQRKKPPTSQVSQHLGQTLDAYTDGGLTVFKTVWGCPLYLEGSLSLHLLPLSPGGGLLPHSMAPASTPALDLLSGSLSSGCSEFQDACPWAHGSCSLCGLCLWVGVGPGPAFNDTVFQDSGSWTPCAPAGKLQA